jgi:hypothetical protein
MYRCSASYPGRRQEEQPSLVRGYQPGVHAAAALLHSNCVA